MTLPTCVECVNCAGCVYRGKTIGKMNEKDTITRHEYVARFAKGVTDRTARRDLSMLEDHRLIERHGSGPKTVYERTGVEP